MNIFKSIMLGFFSIVSFNFVNCQEALDCSVIPGASYFVFEGSNSALEHKPGFYIARFYAFDGNLLETFDYKVMTINRYNILKLKLDKGAPKPQPVSYKIEYRKMFKRASGYWMVFYDKNGNIIGECSCHDEYSSPSYCTQDYDLSVAKKS